MTRNEFLTQAIKANRDMPNGSYREGWAAGPVGCHRDSGPLDNSNFETALKLMGDAIGLDEDDYPLDEMPARGPVCSYCDHSGDSHEDGECEPIDHYPMSANSYELARTCDCETLQISPLMIGGFNHWAVGWIEEILFRADEPRLVTAAYEIWERLEDYPVLDDEHYAQTEWETFHPSDGECYADEPEYCSCGNNETIGDEDDET